MATCGPAALSFAVGATRDAARMDAMHAATPDYTRVDSLLNPLNPPTNPPAQELSPGLTLPPASPMPAAAPVSCAIPVTETGILQEHAQPTQDELHMSLLSSVSTLPSTGDAHSTEAATANGAATTAGIGLKAEDDGSANGSSDTVMEDDDIQTAKVTGVPTFRCMNDEYEDCHTGQVTMELSRKVISDHFGRNKACTRLITDWPLFCRKHYQRATYNQKLWQARKITLILRQLDIIEAQFSGTKYTVKLKKSEEDRLNVYSRAISTNAQPAEAASLVVPEEGRSFEAPVQVLHQLEKLQYLGVNKTKQEIETTVNKIRDMFENGETEQVPSIEFLPQLDANGRPYDVDGRRKPRVSSKGGIKKLSASKLAKKAKKSTGKAAGKAAGKATEKA